MIDWEELKNTIAELQATVNKIVSAYIQAKKEHPDWVHKAEFSKKKRIRKKYQDRIMRQCWRAEDGN